MVLIGIVGTGFMGRTHAAAFEGCDLVKGIRFFDLPQEKEVFEDLRARFSKTLSLEENPNEFFQSDIDAVDVCTPTSTHVEFVRQALEFRKPILCEKPLALSSRLCREMVQEAEEANLPFMVAQVIRFWPEYRYLREVVRERKMGNLRSLSLVRYSPLPDWGKWFADLDVSGGALFDLHIHDIDFLQFLLGKPKRLSSMGRKQNGKAYLDITSVLEFEGGVRASVYGSYDYPRTTPFRMGYRALFEAGALDYDIWRDPPLKQFDDRNESIIDLTSRQDGYEAECSYFVDCLAKEEPPILATAESATFTIELLESIAKSADASGRWIEL